MNNPKQEVIIIVPGVKGLSKYPKSISVIFYFLGKLLNFKPIYEDHLKIWKGKIVAKNKPLWFHWSRNPDPISKFIAVKKLSHLIRNFQNHKIKLVGISMGGEIIIEAIKKYHGNNIKKIILVCSINEAKKIPYDHIKTINIYSLDDSFEEVAIRVLSAFHGAKKLAGSNVVNINLPGMEHSDFCLNIPIPKGEYKGKRPTDIVNRFLRD